MDIDICEKAQIISFHGSQIGIRKADDSSLETSLTQDPSLLFQNVTARNWKESLRFCRFTGTTQMWATLACLALNCDNLEIAEIALMATQKIDKVDQIKYMCNISSIEVSSFS